MKGLHLNRLTKMTICINYYYVSDSLTWNGSLHIGEWRPSLMTIGPLAGQWSESFFIQFSVKQLQESIDENHKKSPKKLVKKGGSEPTSHTLTDKIEKMTRSLKKFKNYGRLNNRDALEIGLKKLALLGSQQWENKTKVRRWVKENIERLAC